MEEPGSRPLSNYRAEMLAQGYVLHGVKVKAAIEAGYAPSGAASRAGVLMQQQEVKDRIDFLAKKRAESFQEKKELTRQWCIDRMKDLADEALKNREKAIAIKALEMLGREVGAFVERKSIEVNSPLDGLSAVALRSLVDRLTSEPTKTIEATSFDAAVTPIVTPAIDGWENSEQDQQVSDEVGRMQPPTNYGCEVEPEMGPVSDTNVDPEQNQLASDGVGRRPSPPYCDEAGEAAAGAEAPRGAPSGGRPSESSTTVSISQNIGRASGVEGATKPTDSEDNEDANNTDGQNKGSAEQVKTPTPPPSSNKLFSENGEDFGDDFNDV